MTIRPHHGMCLALFQGQGYSAGFTAHMAQIKQLLEQKDPDIYLHPSADILCTYCPHCQNGLCDSGEKVARYDRAVLELCALSSGQVLRWSRFASLVDRCILAPRRRQKVCGDCQWDPLCATCNRNT